ncbi:MAG TPA: hypothetical protein VNI55_12345 [Gaiellaceae bacterium]|nr:hypothetical protein [Gaiellaceae bacterium]
MPSTNVVSRHVKREQYIELAALELLLTSNYALGDALEPLLKTIDLTEGVNLSVRGSDLDGLFGEVMPDDEDQLDALVISGRHELLVARMLRAITPDVIAESAAYFERIGTEKLARANALTSAIRFVGEFDAMMRDSVGGDDV